MHGLLTRICAVVEHVCHLNNFALMYQHLHFIVQKLWLSMYMTILELLGHYRYNRIT
jgi:hypothetical protein